ncbi:MAG TPA: hypothetical protein PLL53_19580 [Saprospiraceae bacterium]|nr:hypothetical protein [Saprospiraceae bacterium]
MRNTKLYSILEHFDKYEQNRLRKYLQSPYFNRNQTLIDLFDLLVEDANSEKKKEIEKEDVWTLLRLKSLYDDVRFRKYYSDLLKLVEGFLAQQVYEADPVRQATDLLKAVGKKKMEKLYNSSVKTARHLSQNQPWRHAQHYLQQYQIEVNFYDIMAFETKRGARTNLEEIANNLDSFYLAEKLRIYASVLTQQTFVSQEYKVRLIDEIMAYLHAHKDHEETPAVAVYFQVLRTVTDQDNLEHYYRLKELLDQYGLLFPKHEAMELYGSALNYCIRQINHGNQGFLEELFILYNQLIDKEIIFLNDEFSPWDFRNIVVIALRLGRYEWVEKFIHDFNHKIPELNRDNTVTYTLAQLYFYQKKYDKVIEQLRNVEYDDVSYNLNSKTMLLMTYFETDEYEPLYSLFESFRTYLNRQKELSSDRKALYKNLIKFTKKLTKIMPGDKAEVKRLKEEIAATGNVASLNWIQEKIEELV